METKLDPWKLVELAAARKTTPPLWAEVLIDVIESGTFTRETLATHLHIASEQLTHLGLCSQPSTPDDRVVFDAVAAYIDLNPLDLEVFYRHWLDGDFGNKGDGESPYLDYLEREYQGRPLEKPLAPLDIREERTLDQRILDGEYMLGDLLRDRIIPYAEVPENGRIVYIPLSRSYAISGLKDAVLALYALKDNIEIQEVSMGAIEKLTRG